MKVALKCGQATLIGAEESLFNEQAYFESKTKNRELARKQGIDYVLEKSSLDALMLPNR
ncbi:MAG: amidase [Bacilli bacterium]|nr:amidase [Bacilli bacterium]